MRYAFRTLRKSPGFAIVVILTLSFGIGANTAIFSVVDGLLLRPLPYPTSDRLTLLWETETAGELREVSLSVENYQDWRDRNRVFAHLAARNGSRTTLTGGAQAEYVEGSNVTRNFFDALGVQPVLGRGFNAEEDRVGGPPVAIVTSRFFERWFHGDPAALGKTITLDGTAYSVVGVLPAGFRYPLYHGRGEYFLPLGRMPLEGRGSHPGLSGIGALRPGVPLAAARADIARITRELAVEYPASNATAGAGVVWMKDRLMNDVQATLFVLLGAVAFVLLIGCANVANLLLARAAGRRQEMAVRAALGASQSVLVKQLLTESLVLASLAGMLGIALAWAGLRVLVALLPANTPRLNEVALDARALAFVMVASLLTGLAFGLAPALQVARRSLADAIRDSRSRSGESGSRQRGRRYLVVAEVALSLVLLTGAGLLIESFERLLAASPGFRAEQIVSVDFGLPPQRYQRPEKQAAFFNELLERTKAIHGVESAAVANGMFGGLQQPVEFDGRRGDLKNPISTDFALVTPDYFRLLSVPVKRGRPFRDADRMGSPAVCIIDDSMAAAYFPNQDPIGRRVRTGGTEWAEVVGVVGHVKNYGVDQTSRIETYRPVAQVPLSFGSLVIKSAESRTALMAALREEVRRIDADLPMGRLIDVEESVAQGRADKRGATTLLTLFAGIALALAAVGLYGVISYAVTQRTREMGVRLALGAQRRDILTLILAEGARVTALGVVVGLGCASALTRYLKSLLFEVSPFDLRVFVATALLMTTVALAAAFVPAWRATRVDPLAALRNE